MRLTLEREGRAEPPAGGSALPLFNPVILSERSESKDPVENPEPRRRVAHSLGIAKSIPKN